MRYNNINEVPVRARESIQKLINKGLLQGGGNLNLSKDMIERIVHAEARGEDETGQITSSKRYP